MTYTRDSPLAFAQVELNKVVKIKECILFIYEERDRVAQFSWKAYWWLLVYLLLGLELILPILISSKESSLADTP